ncbi:MULTISPECIES: hypothetical protein [Clostridium]|uniref:Lipoprotein n=1 Tax=Clostridium cibarium TaxID=2762247 RepID=A0ABR8PTN9_9CLOT|nr:MULTISPECIES: hypothetical protein [Clostridium]MBD7911546.1 hypothetical protein [Clostridium cibarium]
MFKERKFALFTIVVLLISLLFSGCNAKNTIEDAGKNIKQGTEKVSEDAKDIVSKIKDESMGYSKDELKKELAKKGITLEKQDTTSPYFSVKSEDYKIVGGSLIIYEYNLEDKEKIISDLKTVTENGSVINGTKINWLKAPHIYKKGRVVVIYDGDDEAIKTNLKEILGEPLLG